MRDWALALYHGLPYWGKVAAASLHGYRLRGWRYGPETEALVEEILDRETWSGERLRQYQQERLARMLHHAATKVPYYRERWGARRRRVMPVREELLHEVAAGRSGRTE